MYYKYQQNNSGGDYIQNEDVDEVVIIEASSAEEANSIAESVGIYFDGCATDTDCACCGDRWYRTYEDDGLEDLEVFLQNFQGKLYIYTEKGKTKASLTLTFHTKPKKQKPLEEEHVSEPTVSVVPALTQSQLEAARVYNALINAVSLPAIFGKESIAIVLSTLKADLARTFDRDEEDERRIMEAFVEYLEKLKK